jgi:hypothetical protein
MSRHARRVDDNHGAIREALRQVPGVKVYDSSGCGRGLPDLLVTHRHALFFVELKDGTKAPSARRLTPAEAEFKAFVSTALGVSYEVVESVEQALRLVGVRP